jgi:hypothetical protein
MRNINTEECMREGKAHIAGRRRKRGKEGLILKICAEKNAGKKRKSR